MDKIQKKLNDIHMKIKKESLNSGVEFLAMKNNLLLQYITKQVSYHLSQKDDRMIRDLLVNRMILERLRPTQRKLNYKINKLVKIAASKGEDMEEMLEYAPHPENLVEKTGKDVKNDVHNSGDTQVYQAPKMTSMPYEEEKKEAKERKKEEMNKKKIQKSTLLHELRQEYSEQPEEMDVEGKNHANRVLDQEKKEQLEYEESRFVRLVTSKKDKQRKRKLEQEALRVDSVTNIDSFSGVRDALGLEKHTPYQSLKKHKLGGKTGGIFAHVNTSKKPIKATVHKSMEPTPTATIPKAMKKGAKTKVSFKSLFQ